MILADRVLGREQNLDYASEQGHPVAQYRTLGLFLTADKTGPCLEQAVAGEEAIYLVTGNAPFTLISLFTGRIGKPLAADNGVFEMSLSDLPANVR